MSGPGVVVDTNVFVSARDRHERGFPSCRRLIDGTGRGEFCSIVSTVAIVEIRAGLSAAEIPTA